MSAECGWVVQKSVHNSKTKKETRRNGKGRRCSLVFIFRTLRFDALKGPCQEIILQPRIRESKMFGKESVCYSRRICLGTEVSQTTYLDVGKKIPPDVFAGTKFILKILPF